MPIMKSNSNMSSAVQHPHLKSPLERHHHHHHHHHHNQLQQQQQSNHQIYNLGHHHNHDDQSIHSGLLSMIQKKDNRTCKVPVSMKIYKKSFGLYAVVSADKAYSTKSVYVNLNNSFVKQMNDSEFTIITNNTDGHSLTFQTRSPQDTQKWLGILQTHQIQPNRKRLCFKKMHKISRGHSNLPSVAEDFETHTEEQLSVSANVLAPVCSHSPKGHLNKKKGFVKIRTPSIPKTSPLPMVSETEDE